MKLKHHIDKKLAKAIRSAPRRNRFVTSAHVRGLLDLDGDSYVGRKVRTISKQTGVITRKLRDAGEGDIWERVADQAMTWLYS